MADWPYLYLPLSLLHDWKTTAATWTGWRSIHLAHPPFHFICRRHRTSRYVHQRTGTMQYSSRYSLVHDGGRPDEWACRCAMRRRPAAVLRSILGRRPADPRLCLGSGLWTAGTDSSGLRPAALLSARCNGLPDFLPAPDGYTRAGARAASAQRTRASVQARPPTLLDRLPVVPADTALHAEN
jgi:hypothetical protein